MTHPVGTRVKKVRGVSNVGNTGVVVPFGTGCVGGCAPGNDITVRHDQPAQNVLGAVFPAGKCLYSLSSNWEPILLSGLEPAEEDFKIEDLLHGQRETTRARGS